MWHYEPGRQKSINKSKYIACGVVKPPELTVSSALSVFVLPPSGVKVDRQNALLIPEEIACKQMLHSL